MKEFASGRWLVTEGQGRVPIAPFDSTRSLCDEFSSSDYELATEVT